eukprot:3842719-Rhodomonas_salina.3
MYLSSFVFAQYNRPALSPILSLYDMALPALTTCLVPGGAAPSSAQVGARDRRTLPRDHNATIGHGLSWAVAGANGRSRARRLDVTITSSDDNYFVFEDMLADTMSALSRDPWLVNNAAVFSQSAKLAVSCRAQEVARGGCARYGLGVHVMGVVARTPVWY